MTLFLSLLQCTFISSRDVGIKVKEIAQEMRVIGLECHTFTSAEMKQKRLQFLNNNKDASIEDLIQAIEMEIDKQNIIALLKIFDSVVCKEYIASIQRDYDRGIWAIDNGYGYMKIERLLYWGML
jgi:hypothetical protein